jgi:hypothetical protein
MTLALLPFGPFFWTLLLNVHSRPAETQFLHGFASSPTGMHFTLRRWHYDQSWSAIGGEEALSGDSVILTESQALLAGVAGGTPEEDDDISLQKGQLCNSMLV